MEEKKGFFKRLVAGLAKTRDNIVSGIDAIFNGFSSIDDDFYDEIEEILVMGDIGISATTSIIEDLKVKVKEKNIKEIEASILISQNFSYFCSSSIIFYNAQTLMQKI